VYLRFQSLIVVKGTAGVFPAPQKAALYTTNPYDQRLGDRIENVRLGETAQ
jgi:hypothetical protein